MHPLIYYRYSRYIFHDARADYKLVDWSIDDSVDFSDRFPSFHLIELNIKIIFHWLLEKMNFIYTNR